MASPQVTVRLEPETYKTLLKLAELEKKTIAEMTRELIEHGLGKRTAPQEDISTKLQFLETNLSELVARSIKASAVAAYYAKLATETADEAAHYMTNGEVLDKETKKQRAQDRQKRSKEIAQHFLTAALEQI